MLTPRTLFSVKSWRSWIMILCALGFAGLGVYSYSQCTSRGCTQTTDTFKPDVTVKMIDTTPKVLVMSQDHLDRELAKWWIAETESLGPMHCGLSWVSHVAEVDKKVTESRRGAVWATAWTMAKDKESDISIRHLASYASSSSDWSDSEFLMAIQAELEDENSKYRSQAIKAIGTRGIFRTQVERIARHGNEKDASAATAALGLEFQNSLLSK